MNSAVSQGWGSAPLEEVIEILELPAEFNNVWRDFLQLNSARSSNGFGLNPLSYTEIQSFYSLLNISPEPWEVTMIKVFDKVSLKVFQEEQERESKANNKKNKYED